MKLKKLTLLALPLLMMTSCGPTPTSSSNPTSDSTSSEEVKTYAITAENGTGYTITDLSATNAKRGDTITFKVNVTDDTKMIAKVKYNTAELTPNDQGVYSFTMPARAVTISVELRDKPKTYAITAENGEGYTITDLSATSAIAGAEITFKVNVTDAEKTIQSVKANNITCVKKGELYTFDMPAEAVTITVTLASAHTITATPGEGYTISDLSDDKAREGKTVSFKVTVTDSLKEIVSVKANAVDCTTVGAGVYSFIMPNADVTITVALQAAALGLDLSEAQTGYIINTLVPSQSDVFSKEGIKIYTNDGQGNPVLLTEDLMKEVEFSSPDIEDLTQPIESTGVKTIVVTYNGNSRSFQIAVGTYDVIDVDLVQADLNVKVKVTCQYTGITQAQFAAFGWNMDLQHNNNKDGQGWDTTVDTDKGATLDFVFGEDNTVGFSLDITSVDLGAYTTHFGHKLVPNSNGGLQKMDLLFPTGKARRIVVGDKAYTVQFGAFWDKGDCDITISNASDPYDKVKRTTDSVTLAKDENKAMFTITGSYDSYFQETLTEDDLKPTIDICQYNTWTTIAYNPAEGTNDLNATFAIDEAAKTFTLAFDTYDILKNGGEDNGWFFHFGGDFKYSALEATSITMDDGSKIDMDFGKNLGAPSWANDCVTLRYSAPVNEDDSVKVDTLRYVYEEDTMKLEVAGDFKYDDIVPTVKVGSNEATGSVSADRFVAKVDVSSLANKEQQDIELHYTLNDEEKVVNVFLDDLADEPKIGSDTEGVYLFRTNDKGKVSVKKNTGDKFAVGKVSLEVKDEKVMLNVMGGLRQGVTLTEAKFALNDTEFASSLATVADSNGYVNFSVDVTNAETFENPGVGNTKYMFLIKGLENETESSFEFWPGDWAYVQGCEDVTLGGFNYHVGKVQHDWGQGQFRLEKTNIQ